MLGAVVIPTRAQEHSLIFRNFRLWSHEAFHPTADGQTVRCPLVFLFNNDGAKKIEADIIGAFNECGMGRFFASLELIYLDLHGDRDLYARTPADPTSSEGAKAGPNNQFFYGMKRCRDYGRFIFYMETDCVPIRRGWLDGVAGVAERGVDAWVIGSIYRGVGEVTPRLARHINGNALYAVGDPEFQTFLDFWREYVLTEVGRGNTRLAYDCAIEHLFYQPDEDKGRDFMQRYASRFQFSDFIQNISAPTDDTTRDDDQVRRILAESPGTVLLHGRKFSKAVDLLLYGDGPVVAERLTPVAEPATKVTAPAPLVRAKRATIRGLLRFAKWIEDTEFTRIFGS